MRIGLKARELAQNRSINVFKFSNNWGFNFMKRHGLSVRAVTSVGQSLPPDWETKMASFKIFVETNKAGTIVVIFTR